MSFKKSFCLFLSTIIIGYTSLPVIAATIDGRFLKNASVDASTKMINLNSTNVTEGTNLYYTNTRARTALTASSPLTYNNTTGAFTLPASTSVANGHLTSTDWTTFNNKVSTINSISPTSGNVALTLNNLNLPTSALNMNGYGIINSGSIIGVPKAASSISMEFNGQTIGGASDTGTVPITVITANRNTSGAQAAVSVRPLASIRNFVTDYFTFGSNYNFGIGGTDYGGGAGGVVFIKNATTLPTTNPTGGIILYVDAGSLKARTPSGNIITLALN